MVTKCNRAKYKPCCPSRDSDMFWPNPDADEVARPPGEGRAGRPGGLSTCQSESAEYRPHRANLDALGEAGWQLAPSLDVVRSMGLQSLPITKTRAAQRRSEAGDGPGVIPCSIRYVTHSTVSKRSAPAAQSAAMGRLVTQEAMMRLPETACMRSSVSFSAALTGKLSLNWMLCSKLFPPAKVQAWLKHNVEEVGNLEQFLPELYTTCSNSSIHG